ncbi:MAG: hypothetical protein IJC45_08540 [Clostridia bacterium]|nr:hypothetical protein [Clostridia bacterium]
MKWVKKDSGFLLSFFVNLLFNLEWAIPAVISLILHFILDISLWWTAGCIAFWILLVLARTLLLFALNKAGNMPEKQRENKNPYSSKGYTPVGKNAGDDT